jgi:hypothetical protein
VAYTPLNLRYIIHSKKDERDRIFKETAQVLVKAIAEEFALHGYRETNTNSISPAAGFAKGTLRSTVITSALHNQ